MSKNLILLCQEAQKFQDVSLLDSQEINEIQKNLHLFNPIFREKVRERISQRLQKRQLKELKREHKKNRRTYISKVLTLALFNSEDEIQRYVLKYIPTTSEYIEKEGVDSLIVIPFSEDLVPTMLKLMDYFKQNKSISVFNKEIKMKNGKSFHPTEISWRKSYRPNGTKFVELLEKGFSPESAKAQSQDVINREGVFRITFDVYQGFAEEFISEIKKICNNK